MILNQCVVAVVMLSFELWFGGHKSSRELIQLSQAVTVLELGFALLEEIQECLKKATFSHDEVEETEDTKRQVGFMY